METRDIYEWTINNQIMNNSGIGSVWNQGRKMNSEQKISYFIQVRWNDVNTILLLFFFFPPVEITFYNFQILRFKAKQMMMWLQLFMLLCQTR